MLVCVGLSHKQVPIAVRERLAVPKAELAARLLERAAADQKWVRALAQAIVNKLLHGPTARLRAEGGGPLSEAAAALFELEEPRLHAVPAPLAAPAALRSHG